MQCYVFEKEWDFKILKNINHRFLLNYGKICLRFTFNHIKEYSWVI